MKHIVFVIGHYKNGGVSMRATNLANELGKRGYRVTILVTKEIGTEIFFDLQENVELISLSEFCEKANEYPQVCLDKEQRARRRKHYKRLRYISAICQKWDKELENRMRAIRISEGMRAYMVLHPEAIYIPFGLSYLEETYCAAEGIGCKVIYAERNAPELEIPKEKDRADNVLKMLSQANGAVFQTKDEAEFYKGIISHNIAVIHNPIKKDLPHPYIGERRNVIVNFCRVSPQKNLKLLVDAFARLHEEYAEYSLEIYGNTVEKSEELLSSELREYVFSLKLEKSIFILPPAADVHQRVRDCAMFVSSSDFEGLSNSMIEAMAIGLPCVCTDCLGGGAREVVQNEVNGLIVPTKDIEALYRGMKRIIEEPALAQKCGKNAAKIRQEQSVERIVDQWIGVIESAQGE